MITCENILARTNHGSDIISEILHRTYPDIEVVMCQSGWDCGLCPNPHDDGRPSLHVWIENTEPDKRLGARLAVYHDESGHLPDGDCFDFAQLYWNKAGQDLLIAINEEMHLHLEDGYSPYGPKSRVETLPQSPLVRFSFYNPPATNTEPLKDFTLIDAYDYIKGDSARLATETLRGITNVDRAKLYKRTHFAYCTFSGTFSARANDKLIDHSGLLCVDFDHVHDWQGLHDALLQDEYFDTQLLFRSPSGDGMKWIVKIDTATVSHGEYFDAVSAYCDSTYGLRPDKNCRDVSRACFMPFDPDVFINSQILANNGK